MSNYLSQGNPNHWLIRILKIWFGTIFIGQFVFVAYICVQYLYTGMIGDIDQWSESSTSAYIDGDQIGNVAFIFHMIFAMIVTLGGPLQLMPFIRNNYPKFHRINGRVYVLSGVLISIAGLYLIWVRGTVGNTLAHIMTSINGLIIILAALVTIRYAMVRQIRSHNEWAIRLFLAMSGVFFFRVYFNFWLIVSKGAGIDFDSFTGLPLDIIGFCSYIAPQLVMEVYLRGQRSESQLFKKSFSAFTVLLILVSIIGITGATIIMWWPQMVK